MDEAHLIAAVRYVSLNPVRARLVARPKDWAWSSARAHLAGEDDALVTVKPMRDRFDPAALAALLRPDPEGEAAFAALRGAETIGRPLGNEDFFKGLERLLGRRAPGRKPATQDADQPTLL